MDWDRLRVFHTVAEAGSLTHAARKLNLSQSAVSRQITSLEDSLGQILFHRHARGLILTEYGETLSKTVKDVYHQLEMIWAKLGEARDRPSGELRITTTSAFGATWLTGKMRLFLEHYPEINASLILSDAELDLGMREADCAIRMIAPHQIGLIQRKLASFQLKIYASEDYLSQVGTPHHIEDLDKLQLIVYELSQESPAENLNWLQYVGRESDQPRAARFKVNSLTGIYRAVRSGLGIASLPDYMAKDPVSLGLRQILPDVVGPTIQSYFVYPEELRHSKRIEAFRDFLISQVEELEN